MKPIDKIIRKTFDGKLKSPRTVSLTKDNKLESHFPPPAPLGETLRLIELELIIKYPRLYETYSL